MLMEFETNIRTMEYPLMTGRSDPVEEPASPVDPVERIRELETERDERDRQFARQLESVRQEAVERGRQMVEGEQAAWRQQSTTALSAALEGFRAHTDEYLARVEHEVVRLALAVAERVLRRESQLDPLLLSGAVRVALGQIAESTAVRLRVPSGQREMWAELVRLMPGLPLRPEVCADPAMGDCEAVMESSLGTIDLGVRSQLAEIERGFFDRLDIRKEGNGEPAGPDAAGKRD
jgi:flagellar assembly protein FliH